MAEALEANKTLEEISMGNMTVRRAVLPLKKLRDNTIAELDLKNSGLGVDGGMMLAAVLKSNSSVTKVSDFEWLV
jgi:hypothetical protein